MRNAKNKEQELVLEAVAKWVRVSKEAGKPPSIENFESDIYHSALLARLLSGKEALGKPPPLAYSYPWYSLIEDGIAETSDLWIAEDGPSHLEGKVIIRQSIWDIVGKRGDGEYLVTYGDHIAVLKNTGVLNALGKDVWRIEILDAPLDEEGQ